MSEARKQAWAEYLTFLGVALFIGLAFFPVWSRIPANPVLICGVSTFIFGNGFYFITLIRGRIRLKLFWTNLLVQTLLMFLCILVSFSLLFWFFGWIQAQRSPFDPELFRGMAAQLPHLNLPVTLPMGLVLAGAINAFFQFDRKLGPGVLWNWVTGKYYNPREEELVFMFLDLKDSTTLAEQLGAVNFSRLVRDFFRDLTLPVLESRGSVSHYIGDEAVIYWKPKNGLRNGACIKMFFDFEDALKARSDHYVKNYGLSPEFKAGMHIGPVVATEVGEIKSEIVFHGDTLNTAARIQGLCNELSAPLLISGDLQERLGETQFEYLDEGERLLKGKEHRLQVFQVSRTKNG